MQFPAVPSSHRLLEADQDRVQHSENGKVTQVSVRKGWESHARSPHSATAGWRVKHLVFSQPLADRFCFLVWACVFDIAMLLKKSWCIQRLGKKDLFVQPAMTAWIKMVIYKDGHCMLVTISCLTSQPWMLLNSAQSLRSSRGRRRRPMSNGFL